MELPKYYPFMDVHKVPNDYRIVEFNKCFMDSHNSIYDIYDSNHNDP